VAQLRQSTSGSYLWTISLVDIASSWWEGEVIEDRTQNTTRSAQPHPQALALSPARTSPDNDTAILNQLLVDYCQQNLTRLLRARRK
jgi:hypothetical protein